jgi:ABC-type Fe3+-hydroxamate transport system substrate-binding protein
MYNKKRVKSMDIKMTEINEIRHELQSLAVQSAKTSVTLNQIQETQKMMAHILDNQSRQKEKNKGYDSSIERLNKESMANRDAAESNKLKLSVIIAKAAAISAPLSGALLLLIEFASKHFV